MEQTNDAAQDELQQAINNITGANSGADAAGTDANVDVISQIEETVAANSPVVAPEIPAPEAPKIDDAGMMGADPVAAAEPETPEVEAAPAAPAAPAMSMEPVRALYGDPDLDKVKAGALSDIRPILDKLDIEPEKKFIVYKDIIEMWDDKGCIEPAYNIVKEIKDDKQRAEALLYIIETIDRLGIKMPQE